MLCRAGRDRLIFPFSARPGFTVLHGSQLFLCNTLQYCSSIAYATYTKRQHVLISYSTINIVSSRLVSNPHSTFTSDFPITSSDCKRQKTNWKLSNSKVT